MTGPVVRVNGYSMMSGALSTSSGAGGGVTGGTLEHVLVRGPHAPPDLPANVVRNHATCGAVRPTFEARRSYRGVMDVSHLDPLVRWAVGTLTVLALVGCGDDPGTSAEPSTTADPVAASLHPPGTELDDGLVVPEGTMLAGPVFEGSNLDSILGGWGALLTIDGDDPFAPFDAMSTQLRDTGLPMPGSAASCLWFLEHDEGTDTADLTAPVAEGDPGAPVLALQCEASGYAGPEGNGTGPSEAHLTLTWGPDHPGRMWLEATSGPPRNPDRPPAVDRGSEPVDGSALDVLPERAQAERPAPGDTFGAEGNCFVDGYEQFTLPEGARLVATEGGLDGHSVLSVEDLDAAMDDLFAQAGNPIDLGGASEEQVTTADGADVTRSVWGARGGGGCQLLASAGGDHLLISMHSD